MVREAESNAEDDRRKKEEVETRNNADSLAYAAEKMLRDNADKVPADLKTEVEGKVAQVRSALQSGDNDQIKRSTDVASGVHAESRGLPSTASNSPKARPMAQTRQVVPNPVARAPMARPSPAPWRGEFEKSNPFHFHKSQTMARHAEHAGPSFLSLKGMSPPLQPTPANTAAPVLSDPGCPGAPYNGHPLQLRVEPHGARF